MEQSAERKWDALKRTQSPRELHRGHGATFGPTLEFWGVEIAFQPIVRQSTGEIWAREALMRTRMGLTPGEMFERAGATRRYAFDEALRAAAVRSAIRNDLFDSPVSINVLPQSITAAETCVRSTIDLASRLRVPRGGLIFEFTETENSANPELLQFVMAACRLNGFRTAIDDFGAGFSGLALLTSMRPDIVKVDMEFVRGVDTDPLKRAVIRAIVQLCSEVSIEVIAEGIETLDEAETLKELGVDLLQGFLFGMPEIPEQATPKQALALAR